jgi:putative transposase
MLYTYGISRRIAVPWKECNKMSERMKFIAKLLNGEKMTDVCREFEISRVTGHKIWARYKEEGLAALNDRSRKPWRLANQTEAAVEMAIINLKKQHLTWGAPKISAYLLRHRSDLKIPARSTVHAILERHGLVKKRALSRRRFRAVGSSLSDVTAPNDLWCADFKGHFRMGNNQYCYPLTITDQHSRFILGCDALESVRELGAIACFKRVFKEYGMPSIIRTDNGNPFSTRSLFGLSKLSVLWLRLGIDIERIQPGHPEQNGRHERMHRTLKQTVTKPPGKNLLAQQEMLEQFRTVFNEQRPHEALDMNCPADIYQPSQRQYPTIIEDYDYSTSDFTKRVSVCGSIRNKGSKIFISDVFAGQEVGIKQIEDGIWEVSFMEYPLGFFSEGGERFSPGPNPFI